VKSPMNELPVIPFGPVDWYRTVRDQIQHEDSLIMQRLAWLTAAQSFLFTAYAITANASPPPRNPVLVKQQDLLFIIVPAVACLSGVLIYCSVIAGILVQKRLRDAYATHVASVGDFPEIQGSRFTFWLGLAAPILLPLVFLIAWLTIWTQRPT
jgi:hypothetical protein